MEFDLRRIDGSIEPGLTATDLKVRCAQGDLWPDEEVRRAPDGQWRTLEKVEKLTESLKQGQQQRSALQTLRPEDLVRNFQMAVVNIFSSDGDGTGFAIDASGLILTNDHVVAGSSVCRVRFQNGLESMGRVAFRGNSHDLAVVKCALPSPHHLSLSKHRPRQLCQGAPLLTLGYPGLVNVLAVQQGLISALNVPLAGQAGLWHQITAPLNPGNSGGPALSLLGEIIGVATGRSSEHSDGRHAEGLGWAIPFEGVIAFTRSFWGGFHAGTLNIPSPADVMRECNRPDPAHEVQLAVRRLVREKEFVIVASHQINGSPLPGIDLVSPYGDNLSIVLDRYPLSTNRQSPLYLYLYSPLGEIPDGLADNCRFVAALLEKNFRLPHWQFSKLPDMSLCLRYCRQADQLDTREILNAADDLLSVAQHLVQSAND